MSVRLIQFSHSVGAHANNMARFHQQHILLDQIELYSKCTI